MVKTQTVPAVGPCFTNRNFKENRISKGVKEITNAKIKDKICILLVWNRNTKTLDKTNVNRFLTKTKIKQRIHRQNTTKTMD